MKHLSLFVLLNLVCVNYLRAQTLQLSNAEEYSMACKENLDFKENKALLEKQNDRLIIKTKKGKIRFEDYLVEQEDPEMKLYRAVGVDNKLWFALIEEIGLIDSKFILINLKNRKKHYFNALPFISSDGKYIISVSQPEGDDYEGLEVYALEGDDYKLIFKDNKPSYYYLQDSAKWCKNNFYIRKSESLNSHEEFYLIDF